jgi:histone arginine demethylase JMJD6
MGWRKKIARAKKRHRPSLKDWECDGLYERFPEFAQALPDRSALIFPSTSSSSSSSASATTAAGAVPADGVPGLSSGVMAIHQYQQNLPVRLDAKTLTLATFRSQYESNSIPCLIDHIPAGYDDTTFSGTAWPAVQKWTLQKFEQPQPQEEEEQKIVEDIHHHNHNNNTNNELRMLRSRLFKCGEDDDGNKIKIRLKHFMRYLRHNHDDSPLYIFDSSFENDKLAKRLLRDYRVPSYFHEDLFRLVSERRRPPYRWILIGPARSGSTVHQDPLSTNAWNTLLSGQKRWVLFPPHVPKSIVKGRGLIGKNEDDEASHYFMNILPRIKQQAAAMAAKSGHDDKSSYRDFACYEFTQHAGETVFVPHDWWHAVLNITDTVGVTQNYGSPRNFTAVWCKTRASRPRMAYKLLSRLEREYPELAQLARRLNERDRFRMKYEEEYRGRSKQRRTV